MPQEWPNGPIVLGVQWVFSEHLIRMAAALAGALGEHLICAFVDPAMSMSTLFGPGRTVISGPAWALSIHLRQARSEGLPVEGKSPQLCSHRFM